MNLPPSIIEYGFHLRKNGYRDSTIERRIRLPRRLSKSISLDEPEEVKVELARLDWAESTKELASDILASYYQCRKISIRK